MRTIKLLLLTAPLVLLQGCWFVFIPAGVINAAADSISGAEGEHCVGAIAKPGDLIRLSSGGVWKVESVSGTSYRCTDPQYPTRAKLSRI
jgi:hypothetical protein